MQASGDDLDQGAFALECVRSTTVGVRDPACDPVPAERHVQVCTHRSLAGHGAETVPAGLDRGARLLRRGADRYRPELDEVQLARAGDAARFVGECDRAVLELAVAGVHAVRGEQVGAVRVDDRDLLTRVRLGGLGRADDLELLRGRRRRDIARRTQLGDVVRPRRQDEVELVLTGERESTVEPRFRGSRVGPSEPLHRGSGGRATLARLVDLRVDLGHGDAGRQFHDLQIPRREAA